MKLVPLKLVSMLLLAIVMVTMVIGCTGETQTATVTATATATVPATKTIANGDGSELVVPTVVDKVAAIWGPSYEKIVMLGAEDKIIACTDSFKTNYPWANVVFKHVNDLPLLKLSAAYEPNLEELAKYNPQVLFYFTFPQPIKKLQDAGYPVVYVAGQQDTNYVKQVMHLYASALGEDEENMAAEYEKYFNEKMEMITSKTAGIPAEERPRVYFAKGDPLKCDGEASPMPEFIGLAGGYCVHGDIPGNFGVSITMEQLVSWNPEFILLDMVGASLYGTATSDEILGTISTDPKFHELAAVQSGDVYLSPMGVFYWSAGEQVILQVMWMAKLFHPDLFADMDMVKEVQYFYEKFFDYKLTDDQADRILKHLPPAEAG